MVLQACEGEPVNGRGGCGPGGREARKEGRGAIQDEEKGEKREGREKKMEHKRVRLLSPG